jgi:hypothetical protein
MVCVCYTGTLGQTDRQTEEQRYGTRERKDRQRGRQRNRDMAIERESNNREGFLFSVCIRSFN